MKKKVLVTGGPVHAHLDAVKILTNQFKGGTIVHLAEVLASHYDDLHITYLCAKGAEIPDLFHQETYGVTVVYHNGFDDYKEKVLEYAKTFDAMILGAAVANLIPANPWKDKFPSHDYKEGDIIDIPFKIAPRIINMVKKVNPRITLIGYKLLSKVSEKELLRAAKEVLVGSKADCVLANLRDSLDKKIALCKDFSQHELVSSIVPVDLPNMDYKFIHALITDKHYHTKEYGMVAYGESQDEIEKAKKVLKEKIKQHKKYFIPNEGGYIFGSVAVRVGNKKDMFVTTTRGKKDLNGVSIVLKVDHDKSEVHSVVKPTLNAPFLHHIFATRPDVNVIVHYHELPWGDPVDVAMATILPWAPPGTVRDSIRDVSGIKGTLNKGEFFIDNHGIFILE